MRMEECINFLLTFAQHNVSMEVDKQLKQYDLSVVQYGVLKVMWQFNISKPKEIAAYLGVEKSTISGLLDRMEDKGLLTREIDSKDRRSITVFLTEKGKQLEEPVTKTIDEINAFYFEDFSPGEVLVFKENLKKIINKRRK